LNIINIKKFGCILLATLIMFSTVSFGFKSYAENDEKTQDIDALTNYNYSDTENEAVLYGFVPVLKNADFTLYYKSETSETAVYNRNNNEMVYSNPQDISSDVTGLALHRIKSQLYITYYVNNTQAKYYSSFYDCVNYGQNKAQIKDDSLIVEYVFGKESYSKEMLPIAIPKDKYEKILDNASEEDKEVLENAYKLTSIEDAKTDVARNKLIERYKNIEKTDLYVLDRYIPDYEVEPVYKSLFKYYKIDDFKEDNKAAGGPTDIANDSITFDLSLVYSLNENGLSVSLDCSQLRANENADIDSVAVLEFFGCSNNTDNGYSLIPDGSGGVVNFNSNKNWAGEYSERIYGDDAAIGYTNTNSNKSKIQLPIFAISKNNSGILAVADKGAELCNITFVIADDTIPFNRTAFTANLFSFDKMYVLNPEYGGGTSEVYVREEKPYTDTIDINYYFLEQGKNSYADIAAYYRNLLISDGTLKKKSDNNIPFVFELVGAVDVNKHFLGIPYTGYEVLTSFEQAEKIVDNLSEMGIPEMKVRYSGWFNGGLRQTDISKMKILSCLGSKKKFSKLMENKKADIFPQINVLQVSNKLFDGFSVKNDAIRLTYNETALLYPLSLSRSDFDYEAKYSYLLSPSKYIERAKSFNKKFDYQNVAISDLATLLNSDFSSSENINRVSSQKITTDTLKLLKENRNIMASVPNKYAVPYVDIMVDMPIGTSGANIFDLEIPFVQMVFAGYIDMACEPINISDNKGDLLTLMAFNTLPNYTFMYAESSVLKDTDYSNYYSLSFNDWKEDAVKLYIEYSNNMQKVRGSTVTGWEILADNVVKVSYENGYVLIINKNNTPYETEEFKVSAQGYILKEEGLQ